MRTKANSDNALRGSIQSIENRDHRETSMAMHVLVVANEVGPDVWRLSDQTGYKVADIRKFEYNLRAAGLWRGGFVDSIEWLTEEEDERKMFVLYVQAQVARGLLPKASRRELRDLPRPCGSRNNAHSNTRRVGLRLSYTAFLLQPKNACLLRMPRLGPEGEQ